VGPLGGKRRIVGWEGREECCGKSAPPRLSHRPVSIKDRWVGLCEQVLNILITCWYYEPSKPISMSLINAGLKPTASMTVREEKLGGVLWIGQPVCWRYSQESLFLRSSVICLNLLVTYERLLYANYVRYVWSRTIRGPSMKNMWRVGQVFPGMVYIDLNRHDSQI
jgi:hypothetical protein